MAASEGIAVTKVSEARCAGGTQAKFTHASAACSCEMTFSVFVPEGAAAASPAPVLYFLSGLTCTDDNFSQKAGAQRYAAEHNIALVMPDTSPRGDDVADDDAGAYDFGKGAGFYLDAAKAPFDKHYRMESYVTEELPRAVAAAAGPVVDTSRASVFGHSMGGHGALTLALRHPGAFRSCSAFAPICNPTQCPWGLKAFAGYLGDDAKDGGVADRGSWASHDATELVKAHTGAPVSILVHQGLADNFLTAGQLRPEALVAAAVGNDAVTVDYRAREGYDHSYWFISSFVGEHIAFHAEALKA